MNIWRRTQRTYCVQRLTAMVGTLSKIKFVKIDIHVNPLETNRDKKEYGQTTEKMPT